MLVSSLIKKFQQHTKKLANGDFVIFNPSFGMVDIFKDSGWENISRYRFNKGKWIYVSGERLTKQYLSSNFPV